MKMLRLRRRLAFSLLTMAIAALLVTPTGALAGDEAGPRVTPWEATAEPTGEPAPTTENPPPSTGWVPQGGTAEGSGGGNNSTQQGSSLGSGGSPDKSASKSPTPSAPTPSAPPAPIPPSDSYETEATTPPTVEEPVSGPAPEPEASAAKPAPEPPTHVNAHVALEGADAVLSGSGGVKGVSASSAGAASLVSTPDSGGLPWLALIVCTLILVFAGARLVIGPIELDSLRYSRFRLVRRAAPRG